MSKGFILRKTIEVGSSTMLSRILGLVREILTVRYLGAGVMADAFVTAFKIPNSLRKIFAEGALSAVLIPTFVTLEKQKGKEAINSLMSLTLLVFEGILAALCLLIFWKAEAVIRLIAPGWYTSVASEPSVFFGIPTLDTAFTTFMSFFGAGQPAEQAAYAVIFLRILIGFILFLSISALLGAALQSVRHFFVPAFAQVLINVVFITGLIVCMIKGLPVTTLCFFILFGGFLQLLFHAIAYKELGFNLGPITQQSWKHFKDVVHKFLPCLFSMSVMEINLFIDTSVGSFLPAGSVALIYYANRFMGIPLGVFATAFSTILLPHFSHVSVYAPQRLNFYLLESAKFIFWVTTPVALFMGFFSEKIFSTLFLSQKFTMVHVYEASHILQAFLVGLFVFSFNKILLNLYYAFHETMIPMYISIVGTVLNFILSYYIFMPLWGATGIACATTASEIIRTVIFAALLYRIFDFKLYGKRFADFMLRYCVQLILVIIIFFVCYYGLSYGIMLLPPTIATFLMIKAGFWLWMFPLAGGVMLLLYKTRKYFGIKAYFLD